MKYIEKKLELRAGNIKSLEEKRAALVEDMEKLVNSAKNEVRAMTEDETTKFDDLEKQIKSIDKTIDIEKRARELDIKESKEKQEEQKKVGGDDPEVRAFDNYIRGVIEERADVNLTVGNNGAVIPKTIANKIIEKVKELSPIYQKATKFNTKGELSFPVYDESTQKITCAYQDEFASLTSTSGKFTSVALKGFLSGALSKVSLSLVNNSDFNLVDYVVLKMAQAIAEFLEKELLVGTPDKMTGALSTANIVTTAASTAITADELIDLQMELPQVFQKDAVWTMARSTFKAIRKLKDGDGNYLLNKDATMEFGWELLGKPVYISENMPVIAAGAKPVLYGDLSGIYVKLAEDVNVQVLRERYADEHAVGVIGWVEADSKIVETQKIAALKCKDL